MRWHGYIRMLSRSCLLQQVRGVHHPKRPRSVFQQMASPLPPFRDSKRQAGSAEYNLVLSRGMQLLTSAAGLDAEPEPEPEQERQPVRQQPLQATLSSNVSDVHQAILRLLSAPLSHCVKGVLCSLGDFLLVVTGDVGMMSYQPPLYSLCCPRMSS